MNTISYAKKYTDLLDEVFAVNSRSAVLDSDRSAARCGANANEIAVPVMKLDGFGNYSRNEGYVRGDVSVEWVTMPFDYERGRMFSVDAMDNEETQNIAFGRLAGEFVRTKAVPEADAFRFASIAQAEGITSAAGSITDGEEAVAAIRAAVSQMDGDEVPSDGRILFITPVIKGMIDDMDTVKSRAVLSGFDEVICVPQSRFYTKIKLLDGISEGEECGGYTKAADGKAINFMIVHRDAVLQFTKHCVPKIIAPENNPDADSWKYGYRCYSLCRVFPEKAAGVYVNHC